jgi:hypothetical protein
MMALTENYCTLYTCNWISQKKRLHKMAATIQIKTANQQIANNIISTAEELPVMISQLKLTTW